jgi:hypothetical protein
MKTGSYVDDWYEEDTIISKPSYNQELLQLVETKDL